MDEALKQQLERAVRRLVFNDHLIEPDAARRLCWQLGIGFPEHAA
ncbi:MAG: hypothetical protein WDA16_09420 [Candidatus Thermoplasmatota archaeon]